MDAKLKSGVLAVSIVGGLVVVVGAVVAIASGGGKDAVTKGPDQTATRDREREEERAKTAAPVTRQDEKEETRLVKAIASHPWWKTKPSEDRVRALVAEMTELQADDVFELTPSGGSKRIPLPDGWSGQGRRVAIKNGHRPIESTESTYVFLDGSRMSRRLTRLEAAERLKSELDTDDFRRRK